MREAKERIFQSQIEADFIYSAVYGVELEHADADVIFEAVTLPRIFQWNFMHHKCLGNACVDIDGVLCADPTEEQNDDGEAYIRFLSDADPLFKTSRKIGWLVTSRLEKYRPQTTAWLAKNNIEFDHLIMLDLPSKQERQRLRAHGAFKGRFYRDCDSSLFIESDMKQAEVIAELSGKPVLSIEDNFLYKPDPLSPAAIARRLRNFPTELKVRAQRKKWESKRLLRRVAGEEAWRSLRKIRHFTRF